MGKGEDNNTPEGGLQYAVWKCVLHLQEEKIGLTINGKKTRTLHRRSETSRYWRRTLLT